MFILSLALTAMLAVSNYQPQAEIRPTQSEPADVIGEQVSYRDIDEELGRFIGGECRLITMDSDYGCLPEEQVLGMVKNLLFTFDNRYIVEARDCDDLGWEFLVKLRRFFRDVSDDVPLAAPVGLIGVKLVSDIPEMGYFLHGGVGYHAVVIVRCKGGKWLLVDPGTKKVTELTQHLYEGTLELRLAIF